MSNIRTQAKDAILALLAQATFPDPIRGHNTWASAPSRRLKLWNAVDPSAQPACFLVQHREGYVQKGVGKIVQRYLDCGAWCYAPTGSDSDVGDDYIDTMEAAIEAVMKPDDPSRDELTLGGLVYWARIMRQEGLFIRDPGDIDGQALLVLPIRILLP